MTSLDDLRRRINDLDRQILELVGRRQETSREIARAKRATGHATRDYNREREVLLAAREAGREFGVSPQVAESLLRLLIRPDKSLPAKGDSTTLRWIACLGRQRSGPAATDLHRHRLTTSRGTTSMPPSSVSPRCASIP